MITIVHLYAKEMNIYGDNGNVLVLRKRLEWRGHKVRVVQVGIGESLPKECHMIIGGGGQDVGQERVAKDLLTKKDALIEHLNKGTPMLMICGMYQLFGDFFTTTGGTTITGLGIFGAHTIAKKGRIIGNIAIKTDWGTVVGYENHSGRTYLNDDSQPFGKTRPGCGNNAHDATEGVVKNNAYGSYLHGPMLAKSPQFADHLIGLTLKRAELDTEITPLDDEIENSAQIVAQGRPR